MQVHYKIIFKIYLLLSYKLNVHAYSLPFISGKYVPAIAHKIHTENQGSPKLHVNLKGIAVGDGFTDPVNMLNYGEYLHNVGLLNAQQKAHFQEQEKKARDFILKEQFTEAFYVSCFQRL